MGSRAGEWARLVVVVSAFTALLWWFGVPSPPLFGGLCGALVVALRGSGELRLPAATFRLAQATIGATVAAQIDPEALRSLGGDWAPVWTVIAATLVFSVAVGQLLRLHGVSITTATFASIAGGAAGMTALAHDSGADDRIVVVVQYFRVLVILLTLPLLVTLVFAPHVDVAAGADHTGSVRDYAFSALAIAGGLVLGRLARLPSPALLGTMLAGGMIGLLGVFDDAQVPEPVQNFGFLLIGAQAGLRFTPATLRLLAQMFPIVLIMVTLLIAGCGLLGIWLSDVTGESRLDGYLATSPGGLPVVLATVSETSGNVTFVSAVQLLRLLLVLILAPVVAAVLMRFRRR
ncbi:MAG: AbrB family transcriptional regulator [Propionibacteriales bacterium]|nr:AbrB family transcriptional regulator [Propionibacteriales bacterium]